MKKLFIILLMVFACSSQPKVKVGQIWEYRCNDPFDKFTKTMLIIDIKEGYAQYLYKWSTLGGVYTGSDEKAYFNYKTCLRKATHDDSVMFKLIPKVCEEYTLKGIDSSSVNTLQIKFNTSPDTILARYTEGDSLLWIKLYNGSEMTLKREKTGFRIIKLEDNGSGLRLDKKGATKCLNLKYFHLKHCLVL